MQAPTNIERPEQLVDLFDQTVADITGPLLPNVISVGENILFGFAVVIMIIKGVKIALGSGDDPASVLQFLLVLIVPFTMLHYYATPMIGPYTFPQLIMAQGTWLEDVFSRQAVTGTMDLFFSTIEAAWKQTAIHIDDLNVWAALTHGMSAVWKTLVTTLLTYYTLLMFGLIWILTTAQVLMAQVLLAIYVVLGPIFIPALIVPPISGWFWGWLRGLFVYTLYGPIAGIMQAVVAQLGNRFLRTLTDGSEGFTELVSSAMVSTIIFAAGLLAALKIHDIASGIIGGAGPSASGMLVGAATTAATAGGSSIAKGGAGAIKGR